jgi:hypothetical protein
VPATDGDRIEQHLGMTLLGLEDELRAGLEARP